MRRRCAEMLWTGSNVPFEPVRATNKSSIERFTRERPWQVICNGVSRPVCAIMSATLRPSRQEVSQLYGLSAPSLRNIAFPNPGRAILDSPITGRRMSGLAAATDTRNRSVGCDCRCVRGRVPDLRLGMLCVREGGWLFGRDWLTGLKAAWMVGLLGLFAQSCEVRGSLALMKFLCGRSTRWVWVQARRART